MKVFSRFVLSSRESWSWAVSQLMFRYKLNFATGVAYYKPDKTVKMLMRLTKVNEFRWYHVIKRPNT